MKKEIYLPTNDPSPLMIEDGKMLFAKQFGFDLFDHNKNFRHINKQHLYVIDSDIEIKEWDWIYNEERGPFIL